MKEFQLKILASDKMLYDGPCVSVTVPLSDGYMGILGGHSNMVSAVVTGVMTYRIKEGGELLRVAVSDGLLKVENNELLLLVDTAERAQDIDVVRAERAAEAARNKLLKEQSRREQMAVEADLARAISRIDAAKDESVRF